MAPRLWGTQGASAGRIIRRAGAALLLLVPALAQAQQLPQGGSVAAGSASIGTPHNGILDINQSSNRAILDWHSFSIGQGGTVNFNQPSAASATLNRVTSNTPSSIAGTINAPGTVLLVNPNGIAITKTGVINTGSFAASTLDIKNSDFMAGHYTFRGNGASAAVTNAGRIDVSDGGFAALLGGHVANDGLITARLGHVALGSGELITLDLSGDGFLSVGVPTKDLGKLKGADGKPLVSNRGKIVADGGVVELKAATAAGILRDAVNVPGSIEATSVGLRNGKIVLGGGAGGRVRLAGNITARGSGTSDGGKVKVTGADIALSGAIDASTSGQGRHGGTVSVIADDTTDFSGLITAEGGDGGSGGFVETSGAHVHIADTAKVVTLATNGTAGSWLIDPADFTIAATGGDITGATLSHNLAGGDVTISSNDGTVNTAGDGDIFVNDAVSWSADTTLTLDAVRNIDINAPITVGGTGAGVVLSYGGDYSFGLTGAGFTGRIDFTGGSGSSAGLTINGNAYTLLYSMTDLAGINTNSGLQGRYALATSLEASSTTGWLPLGTTGLGTTTINSNNGFTGTFTGLGHTISNLTVYIGTKSNAGLFGYISLSGTIRDIGMVGGSVSGSSDVGGLVGWQSGGTISQAYATGAVTGSSKVGGLVGDLGGGSISQAYATGTVSGSSQVGGLAGAQSCLSGCSISQAYATGTVGGGYYVGGLVGAHGDGSISDAYATGAVTGSGNGVGGLVGLEHGTITSAYATGAVGGSGTNLGGLVGLDFGGTYTDTYWDTDTAGPGVTQGVGNVASAPGVAPLAMAALTSVLPTGFDPTIWANQNNQTTPYLLNVTPTELFVGGSTTPFTVVTTLDQLQAINNDLSANYALFNDIDASATATWNGGSGFVPLGTDGANKVWDGSSFTLTGSIGFTGTFDGLGHTISGLTIYRPTDADVGLFGFSKGTIEKVGLVGGSVSGNGDVGGLVGDSHGMVTDAYATGAVSGNNFVGGLVGVNDYAGGTIKEAYATGKVSGGDDVGGLVGLNQGGDIIDAYATGAVSGGPTVGGLVGGRINGTITNSYWDTTTTGQPGGCSASPTCGGGATAVQSADPSGTAGPYAFSQASYTGWDFTATSPGAGTWFMIEGQTRPFLQFEYSTTITNSHQLQLVSMDPTASYTLVSNIDLAPSLDPVIITVSGSARTTYPGMWGASGFVPIGTDGAGAVLNAGDGFTGSFDGGGHTISGLIINRPSSDYVGLFGYANDATIQNVGLVGDSISGSSYAGGLVGYNDDGLITIAYADGTVTGGNNGYDIGGLVGYSDGKISHAHAKGTVSGSDTIGGLVGENEGKISHAYARAEVSGGDFSYTIGGLVGYNGGKISHAHATGKVSGGKRSDTIGGLVGYNDGKIKQAYATGKVSGGKRSDTIGGLVGYNDGKIKQAYATGKVSGGDSTYDIGGLVGENEGIISGSHATGKVSAGDDGEAIGGLVGYNQGTINDVSYATGDVNTGAGGDDVGGLVGQNDYHASEGHITDAYATGNVSVGNNSEEIAGLVGDNEGTVSNAYATGNIDGGDGGEEVGGLVGENDGGTISDAYATGAVGANNGEDVGGLAGWNWGGGTINDAYATGDVGAGYSGTYYVGGLVGYLQDGTISNAYAKGDVSGNSGEDVGGLVGEQDSGTIENAYATGNVSGTLYIGGLVGQQFGGTISQGYYDSTTTGQANGNQGDGSIGLTTQEWLTQGPIATGTFDTTTTWVAGYPYPVLQALPYVLVTAHGTLVYGSSTPTGVTVSGAVDQNGNDATGLVDTSTTTWIGCSTCDVASGSVIGGIGGTVSAGYQLTYTGTLTVTHRSLTVSGTRTYDGNTDADASILSLNGAIGGDNVSLATSGSGTLVSKNVLLSGGVPQPVDLASLGSLSLTGAQANDYQLTTTGSAVTITAAPLVISAVTDSKTYDGTASSSQTPIVTSGLYTAAGDSVTGLTQAFTSKDVLGSNGSTLQVTGYTVNDGNGGNDYAVTLNTAMGTITPAPLTVTPNAVSTAYSGVALDNAGYSDNTDNYSITGFVNHETVSSVGVSLSGSMAFNGSTTTSVLNAGTYSQNVGSLKLTSNHNNYVMDFSNPTPNNYVIDPAILVASLRGTVEKTFDGNTVATLVPSNYDLSGIIGSDSVTLNAPTTGSYDTPYVGTGKIVTVSGLALLGPAGGNYVLAATTISGPVGIIDQIQNSTSHYGSSGGGNGNASTVNITFQNANNSNTPVITTVMPGPVASNANQNIATGSGPNALYPPISQFDQDQYTNDTLPGFAPQAGEATVLTMIARAEEDNHKAPKINALWQGNTADWPSNNNVLKNVSFSDGNGHTRTPDGNNGFTFKDGTTDIAALLQHGPVALGGATSTGQPPTTPWLLAIAMTAGGKGIIANDPLTGDQVVLAYDPATKTVGGVTAVIDPKTGKPVPLGNGAPNLTGQKTKVPAAVWSTLEAFKPTSYFAVAI